VTRPGAAGEDTGEVQGSQAVISHLVVFLL
jgi:hypothetical protein